MVNLYRTSLTSVLKPITIGLALLGTTACMHDNVVEPTLGETINRNAVTMVRLGHTITAEDDGTDTPSGATFAALGAFLLSVKAGHGDIIMMDSASSTVRRDAVAAYLKKRGLVYAGEAPLGEEPADGTINLYVERYIVTPPACGRWPNEASNNTRNNTSSYFGCAVTSNLGMMVANPRDLIAGENGGNSTAAAVGALYTPTPQPTGPTMTFSIDGMPPVTQPLPMPSAPAPGNN
ncbi:CpaD family pilus assembly lipoprotein [Kordiimonas sp.]|uniref:CpaD family pilus assembly lipoprotein n=1 Tax=Kordiimonas sp. TaxID=1970157 RepID=UPI003A938A89